MTKEGCRLGRGLWRWLETVHVGWDLERSYGPGWRGVTEARVLGRGLGVDKSRG